MFISFFFDQTDRFFGRRCRSYETRFAVIFDRSLQPIGHMAYAPAGERGGLGDYLY